MNKPPVLLRVSDLSARHQRGSESWTLEDISLEVRQGEVLAIVGESGSGKSTFLRVLLGLLPEVRGQLEFAGIDLLKASRREIQKARAAMQIVFQDPSSALNPRLRIIESILEPLDLHERPDPRLRLERARQLASETGLSSELLERFPHELSGGQKQRAGIARALSVRPSLLLLDEPVSALDVSVRAQILNLLLDLRERYQLTSIFVSHDLAVVRRIAHHVCVFQAGRIVERGTNDDVLLNPKHPYTRNLRDAVLDWRTAGFKGE